MSSLCHSKAHDTLTTLVKLLSQLESHIEVASNEFTVSF